MPGSKKIINPTEVKVVAPETISVKIDQPDPVDVKMVGKMPLDPHAPMKPTTTEQEDISTAGQRRINLIWEHTQARIALLTVISSQSVNAFVVVFLLFKRHPTDPATIAVITASIAAMNLTVGIIIGFYFSRTNHTAIGGVGQKRDKLEGRDGTR